MRIKRIVEQAGLERHARLAVRPQLVNITEDILQDAVDRAPVGDPEGGHLRDTGHAEVEQDGSKAVVGFTAPYAGYVSEGTSDTEADPFFTSAIYQHRDGRRP
jgi:hypothetical protein